MLTYYRRHDRLTLDQPKEATGQARLVCLREEVVMGREEAKNKIVVWLIENHPLAARLLRQMLKQWRNVEVFAIDLSLASRLVCDIMP